MRMIKDISAEEAQYILWQWDRQLNTLGWGDTQFQSGRTVQSTGDAVAHARFIAHAAQYEGDVATLTASIGFVEGVLWAWGLYSLDIMDRLTMDWLRQMKERATEKLTGRDQGSTDNAGGAYPASLIGKGRRI